jgi:aspartate/methionine/tyrosine aminotransferase
MNFHKSNSITPESLKFDLLKNDSVEHLNAKVNSNNTFASQFNKEVIACIMNPSLLSSVSTYVRDKANSYLKSGINVGAYSDSRGALLVRRNLQKWYKRRDGFAISEDEIYLTNGGVSAYDHVISLIYSPGESALMPNPCYPYFLDYNIAYGVKNIFYNSKDKLDVFFLI